MDTQILIVAFGAFLIASFLKGLTGLGFSTMCLGLLAVFIDLKLAIPLVILPSISSNLIVMIQAGRFVEAFKRFWPLYFSSLPGIVVGVLFLKSSHSELPKAILGAVMLLYGVWGLKSGIATLSSLNEKRLKVPIGLVSGLVNGATGSQIMPIMPYLLSLKMDRDLFVQTINCSFTMCTLVMIAGLGKLGMINQSVVFLSAGGIIPVAFGIYVGGKLRKRVSEERYRKLVLVLLIVLGASLVVRSMI